MRWRGDWSASIDAGQHHQFICAPGRRRRLRRGGSGAVRRPIRRLQTEYTSTSPDGKTTVEQYAKINQDRDYFWQFWARRQDTLTKLEPDQQDYSASFRFTKVRMQKTGSGELSLYLYRSTPRGFVTATSKPLDALAWDHFKSRPEARKVLMPNFHMAVAPLKGTEENYRSLGLGWPKDRYLALTLSGDNDEHGQVLSVRG